MMTTPASAIKNEVRSCTFKSIHTDMCSICDKQVTLQEDRCLDENGKTVHTDCHGRQILQDNSSASGTAA